MPKINDSVTIASYLVKYLQGKCDKEEIAAVETWLTDPNNKAIFDKIKKNDSQDLYDKHSIDVSDIKDTFYKNFEKKRRFSTANILSYAAVVVLLISLPVLFFVIDKNKDMDAQIADNKEKIELRYEATVLLTSNGEKIVLDKEHLAKTIQEKNGVRVNIKGNSLVYDIDAGIRNDGGNITETKDTGITNAGTTDTKNAKQIAYNTIKVPDCGNFNFTMSDGTKVWLNAGTTLKYPIPFHKNKREIHLDGEAYFEVTKNKKKPFVVKMNTGSVKVLGTKFNVKSYADKPVTTTLASGSVEVKDLNKNTVVLKPNEQAVFTEKDIEVKEVDAYLNTLWKDGYFMYDKVRLDEILQELSKWYGFEYFHQSKGTADILFSARLKKFNDINEVLKILENTGDIKFRIKNNTVIVTR